MHAAFTWTRVGQLAMWGGLLCLPLQAATTWTGTGNWHTDPGSWSGGVPTPGEDTVIQSGTCTLSGDSASLGALTVENGATLVFDNWGTTLTATGVTVESGATVTHTDCNIGSDPSNTNRVHIVCTDLTVDGDIDVSGKGYQGTTSIGQGPGGGQSRGSEGRAAAGGHGGFGGNYDDSNDFRKGGPSYGARYSPITPGSAGGRGDSAGGDGGGVITIEAAGAVSVDGSLNADGLEGPRKGGGGAGGSIYINCDTFTGGGSVTANGGASGYQSASGGGGRIAIWSVTDSWSGTAITANRGGLASSSGNGWYYGRHGTVEGGSIGAAGAEVPISPSEWSDYENYAVYGGDASRRLWSLPKNWTALRVPVEGEHVALDYGGITVSLTNTTPLLASVLVSNTTLNFVNWDTELQAESCVIEDGAVVVHAACNNTSSNRVFFRCNTFTLDSNATVNATGRGFQGADDGEGPGGGQYIGDPTKRGGGGGHGGAGANNDGAAGGGVYGSATNALGPGSGGGMGFGPAEKGDGGGAVRIIAEVQATIDGDVLADGNPATTTGASTRGGGGSGGGIFVYAPVFAGGGLLSADGGDHDTYNSAGGGGRIAVWATYTNLWTGVTTADSGLSVGDGVDRPRPASDGTVQFVLIPPPPSGTVIIVR